MILKNAGEERRKIMFYKSIDYLNNFVPYIPDGDALDDRIRQYAKIYGDEATKAAMRRARKGIRGQVEFTQQESEDFAYRVLKFLRGRPCMKWLYQYEI